MTTKDYQIMVGYLIGVALWAAVIWWFGFENVLKAVLTAIVGLGVFGAVLAVVQVGSRGR